MFNTSKVLSDEYIHLKSIIIIHMGETHGYHTNAKIKLELLEIWSCYVW